MRHIESNIQKQCVSWFRLQYPKLKYNLIAVGNGGARNRTEAAIMKGEGVTAGVSDLVLFYGNIKYHGLCIEMKTPTGRQQDSQKLWQQYVEVQNYKYAICRSLEDFQMLINSYLAIPQTQ